MEKEIKVEISLSELDKCRETAAERDALRAEVASLKEQKATLLEACKATLAKLDFDDLPCENCLAGCGEVEGGEGCFLRINEKAVAKTPKSEASK